MVEKILDNGHLIAIIIKSSYSSEGIEFLTPADFSQQLAYMKREKNHVVLPHTHITIRRVVHFTQEVLFIKSGAVRVDFYSNDQAYIKSKLLKTGDVVFLAGGGHGLKMLEESEIIEVKQGPYVEDKDKVRFKPIDDGKVKLK